MNLTKRERRALKKEQQQLQHERVLHNQRWGNISKWTIALLVTAAVVGGIAYATRQYNENLPGTAFTNQGREHIALDADHPEYNSNPPTSGSHYSEWEKNWGIHTNYVEEGYQVHNLEHGGIIVHYRPDKITNLPELEALFTELQQKNKKMLLMPNSNIDTVYALTAWTRLDTFDQYDPERIKKFTAAFYNKGPEKTVE